MGKPALALVTLLVGAALAACGTDTAGHPAPRAGSTSASPAPSTPISPASGSPSADASAAATGPRLAAPAFTVHLPRHWLNGTGDAPSGVVAMGTRPGDDLVESVTVQRADDTGVVASLRREGATDVELAGGTRIGGRPAEHASGLRGPRYARTAVDRYRVSEGGTTWQVTFTLNRWAPHADRDRLIASVLASWSWR